MEELYYPCSENNGADQLCSYCTADLCLCFRIGKIRVSHDAAQIRKTESAVRGGTYVVVLMSGC